MPNNWNPNVMSDEERERLRAGIHKFGFVAPLIVRPMSDEYQIIDGENRWEVGVEEGIAEFPCHVIVVDDDEARMLTPILNELHGSPDSAKLGALLRDLQERHSDVELRGLLPYDRARFDELVGQVSVDWDALERKRTEQAAMGEERWVERVYRMPATAAEVVDQAVAKAREESGAGNDWQGLEYVAADFLA